MKIAGFCIGVILFIAIFLNLAAGCATEAPWKWEERQRQEQVIPPPICERVNTITYGKPAECKE